jgi:hypothetical protein
MGAYRIASIPPAILVSGDDYNLLAELRDLNERRDLVMAALRRNRSARPWFLSRWWRVRNGRCPVCLARFQISGDDIVHRQCPIDSGHYHSISHRDYTYW